MCDEGRVSVFGPQLGDLDRDMCPGSVEIQVKFTNVQDFTGDRSLTLEMNAVDPAAPRTELPYRAISETLAIVPSVSVIIPATNEAANLAHVFATLPPWVDEVILVDGHSVDDTVAVTRALYPKAKV